MHRGAVIHAQIAEHGCFVGGPTVLLTARVQHGCSKVLEQLLVWTLQNRKENLLVRRMGCMHPNPCPVS